MKNPFLYVLTLVAGLVGGTMFSASPECPCTVDPVVVTVDPPAPGPLAIEGPAVALPGEQVELKARGDATWVKWQTEAKFAGPYESGRVIVFTSPKAGRFVFFLAGDVKGQGAGDEHVLVVGEPEPPVPPKPPDPPKPPVPDGPLQVTILHESTATTPEMARTFTNLRTGTSQSYLKSKGHTLNILDDDLTDAAGKPSPLVTKWAPIGTLPELVIGTADGKVIWRGPLPATADGVIEAIKRAGG